MRTVLMALVLACVTTTAAAAQETFAIRAFALEGVSLVPPAEIQERLQPLLGEARGFSDLQRAREQVMAVYAAHGYGAVEVNLPPQDVTAGTVQLRVTEIRIADVQVRGGRHFDASNVLASLPHLRSGAPLNTDAVRDDLAQANQHEAKQARVKFAPSQALPGAVDAVVQVEDRSPQGFALVADNTGSRESGRLRTGFSYRNSNLFNRDHVLNLQYTTQPERFEDTRIFGLSYQVPVYGMGQSLGLTVGHSDVDSGEVGGIFTVTGRGRSYGLRYSLELPDMGAYRQQFSIGADWRRFGNEVRFMGQGPSLGSDLVLRPVTLGYGGAFSAGGGATSFNLGFSRNVPGGSDGDEAALQASRAGAKAGYSVLRYGISYARALGLKLDLRLAADGQYTPDLLVSGEQFGVGGASSVRGFDARGLTDDKGRHATIELYLPPWRPALLQGGQLRPLVFADYGYVERNEPIALERDHGEISSAGAGLRLGYRRNAALSLDYGVVINAAGLQERGSGFLHASLQARF